MTKITNNKEKKNPSIKIITAILLLFAIFCLFFIVKNKNYSLISGTIGVILLVLTMNIANIIKISKEKSKIFCIISILISLTSIPLAFKKVIFSYILAVPAFILAKKAIKVDNKNVLAKVSFVITLIILVICIALSITGGIKNL